MLCTFRFLFTGFYSRSPIPNSCSLESCHQVNKCKERGSPHPCLFFPGNPRKDNKVRWNFRDVLYDFSKATTLELGLEVSRSWPGRHEGSVFRVEATTGTKVMKSLGEIRELQTIHWDGASLIMRLRCQGPLKEVASRDQMQKTMLTKSLGALSCR